MKIEKTNITDEDRKLASLSEKEALYGAIEVFGKHAEKIKEGELDMSTYEWCIRNAFAAGMKYAQALADIKRENEINSIFDFFHRLATDEFWDKVEKDFDINDLSLLVSLQKDHWEVFHSHDLNIERVLKDFES